MGFGLRVKVLQSRSFRSETKGVSVFITESQQGVRANHRLEGLVQPSLGFTTVSGFSISIRACMAFNKGSKYLDSVCFTPKEFLVNGFTLRVHDPK